MIFPVRFSTLRARLFATAFAIKGEDIVESVNDEFKENEDLPNTTNPDDWARISGRKGERIINVRTLMTQINRKERSIENISSGQYL